MNIRMSRGSGRTLVFVLAILFSLGLGEALVNYVFPPWRTIPFLLDPELGPVPFPGKSGRLHYPGIFDYEFHHNEDGFRENRVSKFPVGERLLILGDSYVYGIGVNDAQTFSSLIQDDFLNKKLEGRVINAGAPGRAPDYYYKALLKHGPRFRPRQILLFFTAANDWISADFSEIWKVERWQGGIRISPRTVALVPELGGFQLARKWLSQSRLYSLAMRVMRGKPSPVAVDWNERARFPTREQVQVTRYFLGAIKQECERLGASLDLFYVPRLEEVELKRRGIVTKSFQTFAEIGSEIGAPVHDLSQVFAAQSLPSDRFFIPVDGHFTALAHRLVADAVESHLHFIHFADRKVRRPSTQRAETELSSCVITGVGGGAKWGFQD